DYIMFTPMQDAVRRGYLLQSKDIIGWDQENTCLQAWLTECDAGNGVTMLYSMPNAQLLRIADRRVFEASLQGFVDAHRWRPQFYEENPLRWLSAEEARRYRGDGKAVTFGSGVRVEAFAVSRKPGMLAVRVLWRRLPA